MPHRRRRLIPVALAAILLLAGAAAADPPPLMTARPFAAGERLHYRIRLGSLVVGSATLEITGLRRCGDRSAYEFRYTARSNAVLTALYPVRDRIVSWADTLDFRSHRLSKRIREGRHRESCDLRLDHDGAVASSVDGTRLAIPPGCHDVFSALLRLRASSLTSGERVEIPVILGGAVSVLRVLVGEERRVAVPAGDFTCLAVSPQLGGRGPFRHDGPVTVDLSRDARRVPVRISVRVPVVGQLLAELVD